MVIKRELTIDQIRPHNKHHKCNAWSTSQPTATSKVLWPFPVLISRRTLLLNLSKRRLLNDILARWSLALRSSSIILVRLVALVWSVTSHFAVFWIPFVATLPVVRRVLMVADLRLLIALLLRFAYCFTIFSPSDRRKKTADQKAQRAKISSVVKLVF